VVSEAAKLLFRAPLTAQPKRVKSFDPNGDSQEPFFDVVSDPVVKPTAQMVTIEGSQIATSINEKLCIVNIVFLGESMQERRPRNASRSDGLHETALS
jgi:hypothetical protein